MAGSIEDIKKKSYTYVPPTPPAYLMESTSYTLDFTARKFVHIGIDPTDEFQTVIHLITSSRHIKLTTDFLRRIFALIGNILSFILDTPRTNKRITFLETDLFLISSMVYKGENNLVVECKNKSECRVLLNRADLIELNKLEWCISKTIIQKSVIQTIILNQIEEYCDYLEETSLQDTKPSNTEHEMEVFIKLGTPLENTTTSPNLACQIQMYAPMQLLRIWTDRRRARNTPELFAESEQSPNNTFISFNQPDILAKAFDQIDGSDGVPQSVDVNDGPEYFNRFYSPPSSYTEHPTPSHKRSHFTFAEHPTPVRDVKRRLF